MLCRRAGTYNIYGYFHLKYHHLRFLGNDIPHPFLFLSENVISIWRE